MHKVVVHLTKIFLVIAVSSSLICLTLIFIYGIRVPGFQLDNFHMPTTHSIKNQAFEIEVHGGFLKQTGNQFLARANSPHFEVDLKGDFIGFPLIIENIHPGAILNCDNPYVSIDEQVNNLNRHLIIQGDFKSSINLKWVFPKKKHYRFMAIGDTGGGGELEWALIRANQLKADFVVHLGDMFYSQQDVHSAFTILQKSSVPVFNVYGNHDYYNKDEFPHRHTFNKFFSPSNFQFTLLEKTFASLDTASHIFPFNKGKRGKFLSDLVNKRKNSEYETLLFTHQPIANSMYEDFPDLEHGITGFEGAWLEQKLIPINHLTVIAGHVHQSLVINNTILPTYVAGEGIAHRDLITNSSLSKVLVGDIYEGQLTYFSWELNRIPRRFHTSVKSKNILESHLKRVAALETETTDDPLGIFESK